MWEPPDLSVLAKRYVELWQDYLTAAAADPELADSLARLLAAMGDGAALSPWSAWLRSASSGLERSERAATPPSRADEQAAPQPATGRSGQRKAGATPRAAPIAATSHARDAGVSEFTGRIALIDDRLAAILTGHPTPHSTGL